AWAEEQCNKRNGTASGAAITTAESLPRALGSGKAKTMDKTAFTQRVIHELRDYLTVLLFPPVRLFHLPHVALGPVSGRILRVWNCPDQRPDPVQDHSDRRVPAVGKRHKGSPQ